MNAIILPERAIQNMLTKYPWQGAVPKYLYHGTSRTNWQRIEAEGIKVINVSVYLSRESWVASRFGEVVLRVDTSQLDHAYLGQYRELLCDYMGAKPFTHYYKDIPPTAIKRVRKRAKR